MSRSLPTLRALGSLAVVAALAALAAMGCATKTVAPATNTSPAATSPAGAVKLFEWAISQRNAAAFDNLFSGDLQFVGGDTDSAGNSVGVVRDRAWFLAALDSLIGSAEQVSIVLDQNLVPLPDARPGKDPRWHKQIRTAVELKVRIDAGNTVEVAGNALFFMTRGDSVAISQELMSRGLKPDSTRWWIDRVEDETFAGPTPPVPTKSLSLRQLLEYYYSRHLR